ALEVQPAPAVSVLQIPVAGPRLRVLQEVAAVARQGARERRGVPALDERRLRQPQLGFELASVEFHGEARVDPIALLREHDPVGPAQNAPQDRKSTRLNSSHVAISYAVFCLKKKRQQNRTTT